MLHQEEWGAVCDHGWDKRDAEVVCRQLGCGTALPALEGADFGAGPPRIWLDNVNCQGTETALTKCRASPWGDSSCSHGKHASVVCSGGFHSGTSSGSGCTSNFPHPSQEQDASFTPLAAGSSTPKPFEKFLHEVGMKCCGFRGDATTQHRLRAKTQGPSSSREGAGCSEHLPACLQARLFPASPRSGWWMAQVTAPGGSRCFTMRNGGRCAMIAGTSWMPRWCAGSWTAGRWYRLRDGLTSARDRDPSGWTTCTARGPRQPSLNAEPRAGVSMDASMEKMPAWCAQVTTACHGAGSTVENLTRVLLHWGLTLHSPMGARTCDAATVCSQPGDPLLWSQPLVVHPGGRGQLCADIKVREKQTPCPFAWLSLKIWSPARFWLMLFITNPGS